MSEPILVKTMTFHMPVAGQVVATEKRRVKVILDPKTGMFRIKAPDEFARYGIRSEIGGRDLLSAEKDFDEALKQYRVRALNEVREKVIVVVYKRHRPHWYNQEFKSWSGEHVPTSTIGLEYEVLWKIGDHVYSQDHDTFVPHHMGSAASSAHRKVIPWTEEREAFFEGMVESMGRLMEQLDQFIRTGDFEMNLTAVLAAGGNLLALAAPTATLKDS